MSAKFARTLLTALSISALILAGCNSDSTDTSSSTTPTGPTSGGATITSSNIGAVQASLTTAIGSAIAKGPGTHNGAKSGTVIITLSAGKPTQVGITSVKYKAVFDKYSDDGLLYIDGTLNIEENLATQSVKEIGDITLSGAYSAKLNIDLTVTNGAASGTITVDGQKFPISG